MEYEVTDNRLTLAGYLFEMDKQNWLHVYKLNDLEYVDCVDVISDVPRWEFEYKCREWLTKNGIRAICTTSERNKLKADINKLADDFLIGASKEFKKTLFKELIADLNN